jgi:predicted nuclease of predicted toxin-antitoxin system
VKILLDMNLTPEWVPFLQQAGFDPVHWSAVGDPRAPDAELLAWARKNGHVVFTHDLDFGAVLAATRARGPSVLQARVKDPMPDAVGAEVVRVLHLRREAFEGGALVTIDRMHARVRVLPIRADDDPESESG